MAVTKQVKKPTLPDAALKALKSGQWKTLAGIASAMSESLGRTVTESTAGSAVRRLRHENGLTIKSARRDGMWQYRYVKPPKN